jgi:hypothetical protein
MLSNAASTAGIFSYGEAERALRITPNKGFSFNYDVGVYFPVYVPAGIDSQ